MTRDNGGLSIAEREEPQPGAGRPAHDPLLARIREGVMHALGTPEDLRTVQVRHVWGEHYRVNVLVGLDVISSKVAHSYFLVADGDGKILTADPVITRQY